jgi:hypothetical protein
MKYLLIAFAAFGLTACYYDTPVTQAESGRQYSVECIDGVEYWHRSGSSRSVLAVRVNPETMTFVRC